MCNLFSKRQPLLAAQWQTLVNPLKLKAGSNLTCRKATKVNPFRETLSCILQRVVKLLWMKSLMNRRSALAPMINPKQQASPEKHEENSTEQSYRTCRNDNPRTPPRGGLTAAVPKCLEILKSAEHITLSGLGTSAQGVVAASTSPDIPMMVDPLGELLKLPKWSVGFPAVPKSSQPLRALWTTCPASTECPMPQVCWAEGLQSGPVPSFRLTPSKIWSRALDNYW